MTKRNKKSQSRQKNSNSRGSAKNNARPKYSDAFRRKVVTYSVRNGIAQAADKFEVSTPSVTNWRKSYGVTRATRSSALNGEKIQIRKTPLKKSNDSASPTRRYLPEYRRQVAEFSVMVGVLRTAELFKVSAPSVTNWRREFGITRETAKQKNKHRQAGASGLSETPKSSELRRVRKSLQTSLAIIDGWLGKA